MSQSTEYGSDFDQVLEAMASMPPVNAEAIALIPLPSSSQGPDYPPPSSSPQRSVASSSSIPEEETRLSPEERKQASIDEMRARCQSTSSDKTARRQGHEDGKALAKKVISKLPTVLDGWCKLARLADTGKGYAQVSFDGANKFATLQEAVLWAGGGAKPAFLGATDPNDVSHLCDKRLCTIPSHVCVESKEANNSRKGCLGAVQCVSTCSRCKGSKDIFICRHVPRCIRYRSGYATVEDYLENGICDDRSPEGGDRKRAKHV